jgi:Ca2+-binding RTX toxin-like protein
MVTTTIIRGAGSGSVPGATLTQVEACIRAAMDVWARYLAADGRTITINLSFSDLGGSTLAQCGTSWRSSGGPATFDSLSILATGVDPNGADGEIDLEIDLDSLLAGDFFITSNTDFNLAIPAGKSDMLTVLLHEFGHGFGIGLATGPGGSSPFDAFVTYGGQTVFTGPKAKAANGGNNVVLTNDGGHFNFADIMFPSITDGTRGALSPIDIGVVWDVGGVIRQATSGADVLYGFENFNDTLNGLDGSDTLHGLSGNDTYVIGAGDTIVEQVGGGTDKVQSALINIVLANYANVENATLTGNLALSIVGTAGNNVLTGNSAANVLHGGGGVDTMTGGAGNDSYSTDGGDTIVELLNGGTDTVVSTANYTLAANVENLMLSGAAAISGAGNGLDNNLNGYNSAGANVLTGFAGNDVYVIGAGDSVVEAANAGTDTVQSYVSHTLGVNVEAITLLGSVATNAAGHAGNNILNGALNSAANTLYGMGGNDLYIVGAGDIIVEAAGGGTDTVRSQFINLSLSSYANVENITLIGNLALYAVGNAGNNVIVGNGAANLINGALGNDTLTGGAGTDSFIFNTALNAATNRDTITDYNVAADTIRIDNAIFTNVGANGTLSAAFFRIGAAAADSNDYIIYNSANGALSYDADGNGGGAAIQFAQLSTGLAMTNADFLVI